MDSALIEDARMLRALAEMCKQAQSMGVQGVAAVMVENDPTVWRPQFQSVGRFEREPDKVGHGPEDTGTNYFAVVAAKLAEMVSTSLDSGSAGRPPKTGEVAYKGGIVRPGVFGNRHFAAFSGGTPEQDLIIARKGLFTLMF